MKTLIKNSIIIFLFLTQCVMAQNNSTETISKTLSFKGNGKTKTFIIDNIQGNVEVSESSNNTVEIEAIKTITSDNEADLNKGKSELTVEIEERNDSIVVYLKSPFITYQRTKRHFSYNSNNCKDHGYRYKVDFKIKIPANTTLLASTINEGDVEVSNINGPIQAKNINGAIYLKNISNLILAHTINGNIKADIIDNPSQNTDFKTINGKIEVNYKKDLSADIEVKSFHGEFFTNYDISKYLPAKIERSEATDRKTKVYKIGKSTIVRIGNGGHVLKFETLNGDVYLSKI